MTYSIVGVVGVIGFEISLQTSSSTWAAHSTPYRTSGNTDDGPDPSILLVTQVLSGEDSLSAMLCFTIPHTASHLATCIAKLSSHLQTYAAYSSGMDDSSN